jgi:hypothetical protein
MPETSEKQKQAEQQAARAAEIQSAIETADAAKRRADAEDGGNVDKILKELRLISTACDGFGRRLDALESKHLEGHGGPRQRTLVTGDRGEPGDGKELPRHPQYDDDHGKASEPGEPRSTVADSDDDAIFGRGQKQPLFWERQAAADTALRSWGGSAPPPMSGERLLDFRRRLLRPLLKYSTQFKDVDLDELKEPLFSPIEKSVYSDAIRASTDASSVPEDYLREIITVDKTGRRISSFVGQPRAWMSAFAGQRRRLIGIRNTSSP